MGGWFNRMDGWLAGLMGWMGWMDSSRHEIQKHLGLDFFFWH